MGALDGKVAFITGLARGQGRAEAVRLAQDGADIIGIDLADTLPFVPYDSATPDDLAETVRQVEALDRRIIARPGDVRDFAGVKAFVDDAVAQLGGLDIVIANAGICIPQTWDEISPESFAATIDTNVTGVWNTVTASAPHLIARGGGSIVLTSSYAGKKMQPFMIHYTASKHAVVGLTRGFAAELGKHSIRVNSVHPGAVLTGMTTGSMMEAIQRTNESNPPLAAMGTGFLPIYANESEDIANAVAFLVGPEARTITAEHLSIDMGAQYF